jgi:GH25 family lysozyme M1 (1,4-beta-N-acetylmuramidase)/LysM repeat protein
LTKDNAKVIRQSDVSLPATVHVEVRPGQQIVATAQNGTSAQPLTVSVKADGKHASDAGRGYNNVSETTLTAADSAPASKAASLWGVDTSHWQRDINYLGAGDFGIIKVGGSDIGYNYRDPMFKASQSKLRSSGKLVGYYWFAGYSSATSEADAFVSYLGGSYQCGQPVVYDSEAQFVSPAKTHAFLSRVSDRLGWDCVNRYLYTSSSNTRTYNWASVATIARLWVANYGSNNGSYQYSPAVGHWASWTIHQYTSRGRISSYAGNVDLNVAATDAWHGVTGQSSVSPTPAPTVNNAGAIDYEALATNVIQGKYGNGSTRRTLLGSRYTAVMAIVNRRLARTPNAGTSSSAWYVVKSGDYLSKVWPHNWRSIATLNGLRRPYTIYVGQRLRTSGSTATASAVTSSGTYRIQSGDTLGKLATRWGASVSYLARINHITNINRIYAGQTLRH